MTMKMRLKMKNISLRYGINRSRSRHGHKYTKYKICPSLMMSICIKQQLTRPARNILRTFTNGPILVKTCQTITGPK